MFIRIRLFTSKFLRCIKMELTLSIIIAVVVKEKGVRERNYYK